MWSITAHPDFHINAFSLLWLDCLLRRVIDGIVLPHIPSTVISVVHSSSGNISENWTWVTHTAAYDFSVCTRSIAYLWCWCMRPWSATELTLSCGHLFCTSRSFKWVCCEFWILGFMDYVLCKGTSLTSMWVLFWRIVLYNNLAAVLVHLCRMSHPVARATFFNNIDDNVKWELSQCARHWEISAFIFMHFLVLNLPFTLTVSYFSFAYLGICLVLWYVVY
jgi:hypothetical protein